MEKRDSESNTTYVALNLNLFYIITFLWVRFINCYLLVNNVEIFKPFNNLYLYIWYPRLAAANLNSTYKQTLSVEASHLLHSADTHKVRPFLNQVGSDSQNLPVQSTWSKHYLPSKTLRFLENPKLYPVSTISCESFWHILVEFWFSDSLYFDVWTLIVKKLVLCVKVSIDEYFFFVIIILSALSFWSFRHYPWRITYLTKTKCKQNKVT